MGLLSALLGDDNQGGQPLSLTGTTAPTAPSFADRFNNPLSQIGLALMANSGRPTTEGGPMSSVAQGLQNYGKIAQKNKTEAWLKTAHPDIYGFVQAGMDPGEAFVYALRRDEAKKEQDRWEANQKFLGDKFAYEKTHDADDLALRRDTLAATTGKRNIETFFDDQGRETKGYYDQSTGKMVQVGGTKAPRPDSGGITINPDGTVQIGGTGAKVPSNFMPDPANPGAVKPIPGGPGEQLPSELAARIGMADNFLNQLPALKQKLAAGKVTGWGDRFMAGNAASSDQAQIYRQLRSGTDALMRMLTGAGMNETEARDYADRYLPSYGDDASSAVSKLNQLANELTSAKTAALRGRGGEPSNSTGGGNVGGGGGTTKSGIKWGVR